MADYDVICIGGGFAGLTAAHTLLKEEPKLRICVLEAKDRVGGRTCVETLKCADKDGNDTEYQWELGGMWIGRNQLDIMELVSELNAETYDQFIEGTKCIRLSSDDHTKTYTSTLPSVGVLGTLDLGQTITRIERLIKSVNPESPWTHPEAEYLDSITAAALLEKYSWTGKIRDMMLAAIRTMYGVDGDQLSALYFLAYCAAGGSLQTLIEATPKSAQEYKIKGGSQNLCIRMMNEKIGAQNVKLSSPVFSIVQTDEEATVHLAGGDKLSAKHIIIAIPPHQITKITFMPPLPPSKARLYRHMPVGHLIKVIITYRKAYWRLKGFSGEIVTTDPRPGQALPGALSIVYDATSDQGHPALVGFIGGDQATVWADKSVDERRQVVLTSLAEHFSLSELMDPVDYREKDWAQEPYNGGCPVNIVTTGAMRYYKELSTPFMRCEFAGTECSDTCTGFMSGAVNSGKKTAASILKKLRDAK